MPLTLPFTLVNGTTADANQVMADLNAIVNYCNDNLQPIIGTPITIANGGTDAITAPGALANLGALGSANNLSDVADPSLALINLGGLAAANNLSDLASPVTALANLGALAKSANLSDVANAVTALNNLLPAQAGKAGDVLTTDGTNASWQGAASTGPTSAQFRVDGGSETLASGAWTSRLLNTTVFSTIAGASLSGNSMSLPAGTYDVTATAGSQATASITNLYHQIRLRNQTAGATLVAGQTNAYAGGADNCVVLATLQGRFTLAATSTVSLDSYVTSACTGGNQQATGETQVLADVFLTKVA